MSRCASPATASKRGNTMRPAPVQQPCPPVWVGGNSARALRRAARYGDGWLPLPNPRGLGNRRHSARPRGRRRSPAPVRALDDERAAAVRDGTGLAGRRSSFDVLTYPMVPFLPDSAGFSSDGLVEHAHELSELGVTGFIVGMPSPSRPVYQEALAAYGEAVLPLLRDDETIVAPLRRCEQGRVRWTSEKRSTRPARCVASRRNRSRSTPRLGSSMRPCARRAEATRRTGGSCSSTPTR